MLRKTFTVANNDNDNVQESETMHVFRVNCRVLNSPIVLPQTDDGVLITCKLATFLLVKKKCLFVYIELS